MKVENLKTYWFLVRTFRNPISLIRHLRNGGLLPQGPALGEIVFRNGQKAVHPSNRGGFLGTVLEMWYYNVYQIGDFYRPQPGDVVADVGAHVGLFSLWLLHHEPRCRIISLEPSPENYACLTRNLASCAAGSQVQHFQMAVGGEAGKVKMLEIETNRSFDARVTPADSTDDGAVDVVPLAALFDMAKTDRFALLKMDAEGGENGAFATADPSLFRRITRIAMEYHDNLVPGTVDMIRERLSPTHEVTVLPDFGELHGRLFATLRPEFQSA